MLTYCERIHHEREAACQTEQANIAVQQCAAKEKCCLVAEKQQAKAKLEQLEQQKAEKQDCACACAKRETESQQLSPTSSHAVVQRKSTSSLGDSGSGSEIAPL
jgi:hypothetical protein